MAKPLRGSEGGFLLMPMPGEEGETCSREADDVAAL